MKNLVEQGRAAYTAHAWEDAYHVLSTAEAEGELPPEDLERYATAAYMTGRVDEFLTILERAHRAWGACGRPARGARVGFWLGLHLMLRGQTGPATGWFGRAQRLLSQVGTEVAEEGYFLLPVAEQHIGSGDYEGAASTAARAAAIGDRFGDTELAAVARHVEGRARMRGGEVEAGLGLLDEAMVAVTAGELSPVATGLIYCSVIEACQESYAVERAGEWTTAMAGWCDRQPQLVAFNGICLVHRAQILHHHGAWPDAMAEAERACRRYSQGKETRPPAAAFYQQGEVHRLRGKFAAAEEAYREASRWGYEPQPGLALLRLAQGRTDAASAAIRRAVGNARNPFEAARYLPAAVEVLLGADDLDGAREASVALDDVAKALSTPVPQALADQARGAVALASGDPNTALAALRTAHEAWQRMNAPYPAARARELTGLACRALGDEDGTQLELEAARDAYLKLGAGPDAARAGKSLDSGRSPGTPESGRESRDERPYGLTPRELQVLRLLAAGKTNKAIAADLFLSEKTIHRHVSNIFLKLDVPSRAAATAFAYEHDLL